MAPIGVQVLEALAPYIVPVLIAVLGVAVKAAIDRLPANIQPKVLTAVHTAVQATEQIASESLSGPGKKQLAVEMVSRQLASMHINIPEPVISDLIESAVYSLNQAQASPAPLVSTPPVNSNPAPAHILASGPIVKGTQLQ